MLGLSELEEPIYDQHFMNAGLVPLELSGVADLGATNDAAQATVRRFILADAKRRND